MFATRIAPLFVVALLSTGTASAQTKQNARPGFPQAAPRFAPHQTQFTPKPFVAPHHHVAPKPFVFHQPTVTHHPKPFFPPHLHRHVVPVHTGHHFPHTPAFVPTFWGGVWGHHRPQPVVALVVPLGGFWFLW